jgi:predicted transport protein
MFNTLKYAKILEEAGFTRPRAEASVRILVETMEDKFASKQDLKDLEVVVKQDLKDLEVVVKQDLKDLEVVVKQDLKDLEVVVKQELKDLETAFKRSLEQVDFKFQQLESKLTIRMGTMLAASIAIITALQVYVFKLLGMHA